MHIDNILQPPTRGQKTRCRLGQTTHDSQEALQLLAPLDAIKLVVFAAFCDEFGFSTRIPSWELTCIYIYISPPKGTFEDDDFPFSPGRDMLVPWRVFTFCQFQFCFGFVEGVEGWWCCCCCCCCCFFLLNFCSMEFIRYFGDHVFFERKKEQLNHRMVRSKSKLWSFLLFSTKNLWTLPMA